MSFLELLKLTQSNLKKTDTFVTYADGKVYKESKTGIECIGNRTGFVIDNKPDCIPAKIIDFLYLGSQDCCEQRIIEHYNIEYILSVGVDAPLKYPYINHKFVECLDIPEWKIETLLCDSIEFLKSGISQSSNVLVHCNAGVSRSATVVIAYLMLVENFNYIEAYDYVKQARNCINPNLGFVKQLQSLK